MKRWKHNCMNLTTCSAGTSGRNCERCGGLSGLEKDHHLVGNYCSKCPAFPLSFIGLFVFVTMLISSLLVNGFSNSVYTKMKILLDFVQFVLLSFHIKVDWSSSMTILGEVAKLATFNTNVLFADCLLSGMEYHHYMEWASSLLIPTVVFFIGLVSDRRERRKASGTQNEITKAICEVKCFKIRHAVYFILLCYYLPLTVSAIHSLSCTEYFGKVQASQTTIFRSCFLYDLSINCNGFLFQTLQFLLGLLFILFILPFPIGILFFTLRQRKWHLLDVYSLKYGYTFNAYTHRFCFWEVFILLRKAISITLTDTLLIDPYLQACSLLSMSGLYLALLIFGRPFRPCHWKHLKPMYNNNLLLEVLSCLCLVILQCSALINITKGNKEALDLLVYSSVLVFLVLWCLVMYLVKNESTDQEPLKMCNLQEEKPIEMKTIKQKSTEEKVSEENDSEPEISKENSSKEKIKEENYSEENINQETSSGPKIVISFEPQTNKQDSSKSLNKEQKTDEQNTSKSQPAEETSNEQKPIAQTSHRPKLIEHQSVEQKLIKSRFQTFCDSVPSVPVSNKQKSTEQHHTDPEDQNQNFSHLDSSEFKYNVSNSSEQNSIEPESCNENSSHLNSSGLMYKVSDSSGQMSIEPKSCGQKLSQTNSNEPKSGVTVAIVSNPREQKTSKQRFSDPNDPKTNEQKSSDPDDPKISEQKFSELDINEQKSSGSKTSELKSCVSNTSEQHKSSESKPCDQNSREAKFDVSKSSELESTESNVLPTTGQKSSEPDFSESKSS
ncbi:uncharacterized protein LOC121375847 isoform X2 [Gigantopelta aegis]|uniref:uncharacterized protein LOC121375847 isoform X2 n=1 Tax=Gigantopelta aegis TaxID=1735272 RepID=UPI001B887B8A|nr:uncharacterized protein LOC121375847 isoform X2 [Gigantopelta aegis]